MDTTPAGRVVIVHADESCLGNQNEGPSRGGAGALLEMQDGNGILRQDFFIVSPATTNNQMALEGAIGLLGLIGAGDHAPTIVYHSDSQYLVKGITEWVHNWERSGWRRKGGAVQNLSLWQELLPLSQRGGVRWRWVQGHSGHVKNEYADHLAVRAAERQIASEGLRPSEFSEWLTQRQTAGKFKGYDPNSDFSQLTEEYAT